MAIQNPPDKTTWRALRKGVKERRIVPVGEFTYFVAFLMEAVLLVHIICTYHAL
jgi:hypothetical protein